MVFCLPCALSISMKKAGLLTLYHIYCRFLDLVAIVTSGRQKEFCWFEVMLIDSFFGRIILEFQGLIILSCSKT